MKQLLERGHSCPLRDLAVQCHSLDGLPAGPVTDRIPRARSGGHDEREEACTAFGRSGQEYPRFVLWVLLLWLLLPLGTSAAAVKEVIPPAPKEYFNDYAGVVSRDDARRFNQQLEQFERDSSSQVVVAIFPSMQSPSSIEDYTVRVAQSWRVGQQAKDNGAVLFVFVQNRSLYLQVGYGLEGALPDALAKRIIDNEITPRFRDGDFAGGLQAGINAIIAATRGEYRGTGSTVAGRQRGGGRGIHPGFVVLIVVVVLSVLARKLGRPGYYRRGRYGGWTIGSGGFSNHGGWGGGWGVVADSVAGAVFLEEAVALAAVEPEEDGNSL